MAIKRVQVFLNQVFDLCDAANEMKNGIVVG
jgi:hypothetical protein